MQKYQRTYIKGMGHDPNDESMINNLVSEISGKKADDIHHIKYLMEGIDRQDYPVHRLIALTREEHNKFGDKKQYFDYLLWVHYHTMPSYLTEIELEKWFPDCIFDWENSTGQDAHMNMYHFYQNVLERNYYVEVWEYPDHCLVQVYNNKGNLIKELRKETKFEIFSKSVNLIKQPSWK